MVRIDAGLVTGFVLGDASTTERDGYSSVFEPSEHRSP